jgi:hypothetical protein
MVDLPRLIGVPLALFVLLLTWPRLAGAMEQAPPIPHLNLAPASAPAASYGATDPAYLPPVPVAPPMQPASRWYGYQLMLIDVAGAGLSIATMSLKPLSFTYLAAPIVVHCLHQRTDLGLISPVLRVGLPIAGAFLGAGDETCGPGQRLCGLGDALQGILVGMGIAVMVDYIVSFTKPRFPSYARTEGRSRQPKGLQLTSAGLVPAPDGAQMVLGGRF